MGGPKTAKISRAKVTAVLRQVKLSTKKGWGPKTVQIGRQKIMGVLGQIKFFDKE